MTRKTSPGLDVFADGNPLPLDWLTIATLVFGVSGVGKTVFARRALEEVYRAGLRFCLVDPKGDGWGMQASADGRGEGLPVVIFGGDHGDLPLERDAGAVLGQAIARLPQSTILDLSRMSLEDRPHFLARFFEAFFAHNREPILLACDEIQGYAAQESRKTGAAAADVRRCLAAIINIAEQGRKHGIGRLFITQRAPGLHTAIRELAEVVVAFRTTGKNDKQRIREWLECSIDGEELAAALRSLPSLDDGECLFASSHKLLRQCERRRVILPTTFDSSRTPRIGETRREPARLSAPDLAALRDVMGAAVERQKQTDPDVLGARVAELERELTAERSKERTPAPARVERVEVRVEVPVFDDASFDRAVTDALKLIAQTHATLCADLALFFEGRKQKAAIESPEFAQAFPKTSRTLAKVLDDVSPRPSPVVHRDPKPDNSPQRKGMPPEGWTMEEEALYQKFKARLLQEAPALVKVLTERSELTVSVERKVVELDGSALKGRIARLIAEGFFSQQGRTASPVRKELARTGPDANTANIGRALDEFTSMGILTCESDGYRIAPGAKVTKTAVASS